MGFPLYSIVLENVLVRFYSGHYRVSRVYCELWPVKLIPIGRQIIITDMLMNAVKELFCLL